MGLPRITYNSKNVDFGEELSEMEIVYPDQANANVAVAGVEEVLTERVECIVRAYWEAPLTGGGSDVDLKRKLRQWLAWAKAGNTWTLARDSAEVVNTTLSSNASAGASSVVVTSATGITIGKQYVIRSATRLQVVKVTNVVSTTITLNETLDFAFASTSRFRSEEFWPARLMDKGRDPIRERPPLHFDVEINFREDLNSL